MNTGRRVSRVRLVVSVLILGLAVWTFLNRQYVMDQAMLLQYTPPANVAALADATTMTNEARRYFYASRPTIDDRDSFNQNCQSRGEHTIILGCYTGIRIHVFDVTDERLPRVKEVTAAHEMLHAAYHRLNDKERERVNAMIDQIAPSIADPRLTELIRLYNHTEPGEFHNEMHSILATEVRNLSPELEAYYKQYFVDRQVVVGFSEQYVNVFEGLRKRQDELTAELQKLAATIDERTKQFNDGIENLNRDIALFNAKANAGGYSTQEEFNKDRNVLVNRQKALANEKAAIDALIQEHNQKRQELQSLNLEAQSLNNSIDSTPSEVPSL